MYDRRTSDRDLLNPYLRRMLDAFWSHTRELDQDRSERLTVVA